MRRGGGRRRRIGDEERFLLFFELRGFGIFPRSDYALRDAGESQDLPPTIRSILFVVVDGRFGSRGCWLVEKLLRFDKWLDGGRSSLRLRDGGFVFGRHDHRSFVSDLSFFPGPRGAVAAGGSGAAAGRIHGAAAAAFALLLSSRRGENLPQTLGQIEGFEVARRGTLEKHFARPELRAGWL